MTPPRRGWFARATWWLVRLTAVGVAVVVAVRAIGGEQKTPLVQITLLAPFSTFVALGALAFAVLVRGPRRNWTALVLAALFGIQAAWLAPAMGVGVSAADPGPAAGPVRVLTTNVFTGFGDPDVLVEQVRQRQVDLLVVVEITPGFENALVADGLDELLPYRIGASAWGADGTQVWSRWPIAEVPGGGSSPYKMVSGVVRLPSGQSVTVTGVHPQSPIPNFVQQWRRDVATIDRRAREVEGPQIIAGDFNASRDHRVFRRILEDGTGLVDAAEVIGVGGGAWPGFTWPASGRVLPPLVRLDHVLVTRDSFGVTEVSTVRIPGSDHLAVYAELVG